MRQSKIRYIFVATVIISILLPTTATAYKQQQSSPVDAGDGLEALIIDHGFNSVYFMVGLSDNASNTIAHGKVTLLSLFSNEPVVFSIDFLVTPH
ncbi:MAG: hypothetical protein JXA00_02435 [Candidatus Thermoplasmatota archaeon]|nr:hypothetical protein [Candidatus Thermoplasmatota archaeon]